MSIPVSARAPLVVAAFGLSLLSGPLAAAQHTWTGAASGQLSNPANWAEGVAPAPGEVKVVLVFPAGPTRKSVSNDVASLAVNEISFQDSGYNLSGQAVSLGAGLSVTGPNGAYATVSLPIQLTDAQTFSASSGARLYVSSALSGGPTAHLTTTGGSVYLEGSSTYEGQTTVASGGLYVTHPAALGAASAGTRVLAGSVFRFEGSGKTFAEPVELGQGCFFYLSPFGTTAADPLVVSSPIVATGTQAGIMIFWYGVHARLVGPISGPAAFAFGQLGYADPLPGSTIELAGPASWGGVTGIASKIKVLASTTLPPTSVQMTQPESSLGGTGTLPGSVTITSGTLAPGKSPGLLTIGGGLSMSGAASVLAVELSGPDPGTGYDQVAVGGNVTLGGSTLSVTAGFQAPAGTTFTILTAGGALSGTFAGLPDGAYVVAGGQLLQIDYSAHAVDLKVVTNTAPTLSTGGAVSLERGLVRTGATLGTVADAEMPAGSLQVSLVAAPAGVSVTNLANANGVVTASLAAGCGVPFGTHALDLSVSDGLTTAPASVNVTVGPDVTGPAVSFPSPTFVARQTRCAPSRGLTLAELAVDDPGLYAAYQAFAASPVAVDGCTPSPTALGLSYQGAPFDGATFFAAGQTHTLTARFSDDLGNVGSGNGNLVVALQGDLTLEGTVDVFDVVTLMSAVVGNVVPGTAPHLSPRNAGDGNGDGLVDVFDVVLLQAFVVGNVACLTP